MHQSLIILMFNAQNTTVVLKFTVMTVHLLKSWIYYFRIVAAVHQPRARVYTVAILRNAIFVAIVRELLQWLQKQIQCHCIFNRIFITYAIERPEPPSTLEIT